MAWDDTEHHSVNLHYAEDVDEIHVGCLESSSDNSACSHNQTQGSEP